jgi:hypothetical protein
MSTSSRRGLFSFAIILFMFISACSAKGSTSSDQNSSGDNGVVDSNATKTTTDQGKSNPTELPADNFPRTPDPLSITATLDNTHTIKTSSNGFGLSLNGKNADGYEISLTLDNKLYNMDAEGNLANNFEAVVSMTPVSAIDGLPFSQGFLTAVQLGPEGLLMAEPGKLTLVVPGKYENSELIGFSADGDGSNFHMYPVTSIYMDYDNTTRFYFNIMHFSLYGVASVTAAEIESQTAHPPTSPASQDEDELAPLVVIRPDTSELTPLIGKIQLQLLRSHTRLVKPLLDKLSGTACEQVSVAAYRFNEWESKVDQVNQTDYFQQQIASDANALHTRFVECAKTLCPVCIGSQSGDKANLAKVNSMITLATFAEALSFTHEFDDFAYWRQLGNKCAQSVGLQPAGGSTGGELSDATLPTPTPIGCPVP